MRTFHTDSCWELLFLQIWYYILWCSDSLSLVGSYFLTYPPPNGYSIFFLKGQLYRNAKWNVKLSEIFQSRKRICHFPIRHESRGGLWFLLDEAKNLQQSVRSSMIPSPCLLSPLHTILFKHTELRGFLKGNKLLHHQAFECAIYCLAFPLPPGHLQVSATVRLPRGHSYLLSPEVSLPSHSLLRLSTPSGWEPSLTSLSLYSYGSTCHKLH